MSKRVIRSARGEIVDFDLMLIKQQIAQAPAPMTIRAREDFIDQKMKRRIKRTSDFAIQAATGKVDVEETMPSPDPMSDMIDENTPDIPEDTTTIKQKAKKKVEANEDQPNP